MDHIIKILFSERQHYISFHAFITQSSDVYWEVLNCEEFGCLEGRKFEFLLHRGFPYFLGGKNLQCTKKKEKISSLLNTFWKNSWTIKKLSATHESDVLFYSQNCLGLFLFFSFFTSKNAVHSIKLREGHLGSCFSDDIPKSRHFYGT